MKILLKGGGVFAIVLMMGLTSCVSDSCTECLGFEGTGMQTQDTLICADQFDTRGDYEDRIEVYEALGAICNEK